jgi:cell division protein FtsN
MATRKARTRRNDEAPGWVWMLFGLAIGLIVALGVYVNGRDGPPAAYSPSPAAGQSSPTTEPTSETPRGADEADETSETRFSFYEMLPRLEVVIPEVETPAPRGSQAVAIEEPGIYELQVGSFKTIEDADRHKANLALRGIESHIQVVTIDDAVFHRVRVGPFTDLDELNRTRRVLIDAGVEMRLMRMRQ